MTAVGSFEDALATLLRACGRACAPVGARRVIVAGDLEITVSTDREAITIDLSGWQHRFALDDEDEDAAALALDLVGAALFGAVRVAVDLYAGRPRRFTLEVLQGDRWQTVSTQGSRPWNPFTAATRRTHRGDATRPQRDAATSVTALPWAPWAGACGFYGATSATAASELPVDGELDLHNFRPREVKPLVLAYIDACLARGIHELRIVHGKGVGNLRRTVHAILARHPQVRGYRLGGHGAGSWGATIVDLSPGTGDQ
ncbi:MAG TPA: Smr/MutS family protein [Nannocystis sp.]